MLLILPSSVSRIIHLHMDEVGFISQWRAICAGGLAGVAAALVTYPLEVVETRLVVQNCRQPTYIGVAHALSKIYRTEGLLALYRGFSLTVLGVLAHLYILTCFLCVSSFFCDCVTFVNCFSLQLTLPIICSAQFINNTLSCDLYCILFFFRCFPLLCGFLCGPHELGQALAGAPFSLHSTPELY